MNILILSWRGPKHPNAGGAEISTHEHAKGWIKAGHKVFLFTSTFVGCRKEELIDGVNIIRRGRQIFGVQWEAFKWYLLDKHPKFDLVVDQFHGIPFFTPIYIREKKLAFIHEVTKEVWRLNPWPQPLNLIPAILGTFFEPFVFKIYKKIPFITASESTKKDLICWGILSRNITVVHNGVSISKIKGPFVKERKKTLIFLGAITKDKGIEDALRIFSYACQEDHNWQFWIVGKSEQRYLEFLRKISKDLSIDKMIKYWGFVTGKKKYELLAKAHILVNPSIREGWGLVVIEAAAMGTPTVGYNVPGLRDSVINDKTGILSKPNPTDCSKALLSLIKNKARYRILRQNCINRSKEFDWTKSTKKSLELIQKLVYDKD